MQSIPGPQVGAGNRKVMVGPLSPFRMGLSGIEPARRIENMYAGQKGLEKRQYLRSIFDTIPLPTFVVDDDVRIQDYNAAAGFLLGPKPELAFHNRGGEALHCIQAEANGCGRSEPCKECVVRNSVKAAIGGRVTHRETHKAEVRRQGNTVEIDLLVSATPLPDAEAPQVLLLLEDITELLTLRGLLPICCQCKKVRDDKEYWHDIDSYLHTHMNIKLTHGICPSCFAEQMKALKAYGAPVR